MACASFMHGQLSGKVSHPTPAEHPAEQLRAMGAGVDGVRGATRSGLFVARRALLHGKCIRSGFTKSDDIGTR